MTRLLFALILTLLTTGLLAEDKAKHTDPHVEIYGGYVMEKSETAHHTSHEKGYEIGIGASRGSELHQHLYWTAEVDYENLESGDVQSWTVAFVPKWAISDHLWLGAGINYSLADHDGQDLDGIGYQFHADIHITHHLGAYVKHKIVTLKGDHHETDASGTSIGFAYIF